jgi:release factor glutamine methyltransferase
MRATGRDRAWLLTYPDVELSSAQAAQLDDWVERRTRHEPIQYILGETEFYGLTFKVTPAVLIPRPETEHLVEAVLERAACDDPLSICDVGTGSGAIPIALAHHLPQAHLTALDLSPAALAIARENAERHNVSAGIRFAESDLLSAVRGKRFDFVVSNPPYVRDDEILEPQVLEYEPHGALFAGPSGLEIYQRLIPEAKEVLKPGGWLLMEIGHGQREALIRLLAGWEAVDFRNDLQGISRVAIARQRA